MKPYTAIVFSKGHHPCKYRNVTKPDRLAAWFSYHYSQVTAINLYDKQTKEFIKQIKY